MSDNPFVPPSIFDSCKYFAALCAFEVVFRGALMRSLRLFLLQPEVRISFGRDSGDFAVSAISASDLLLRLKLGRGKLRGYEQRDHHTAIFIRIRPIPSPPLTLFSSTLFKLSLLYTLDLST